MYIWGTPWWELLRIGTNNLDFTATITSWLFRESWLQEGRRMCQWRGWYYSALSVPVFCCSLFISIYLDPDETVKSPLQELVSVLDTSSIELYYPGLCDSALVLFIVFSFDNRLLSSQRHCKQNRACDSLLVSCAELSVWITLFKHLVIKQINPVHVLIWRLLPAPTAIWNLNIWIFLLLIWTWLNLMEKWNPKWISVARA